MILQKTSWLCAIPLLITAILLTAGAVLGEENRLEILPEQPSGIYRVALGQQHIFTCMGRVPLPDKLTDLRWWWPDGRPIEAFDSNRVEILPGDQAGSLSLIFSSVQEQDLGAYRCTATYANSQQLTASFSLHIFVPITFEDAPLNQYAVKNEDYKVRCRVKADPSPSVDWKKDHRSINNSDHYVVDSDGLVIKAASESDEGVYTCRVRVISQGQVQERHIQLQVQERPVITTQEREFEGVESETVHMPCSATGKPKPEYQWVNHRGQDLSAHDRFVVDKYTGMLQIDFLRRDDTGIYKCTAKNSAGFDVMPVNLEVVTKPVIEEFKNVTSKVNGQAELICRATGDPAPDIFFHKDSEDAPFSHGFQRDRRIFTSQSKEHRTTLATIKITDLLRTDDGLYNCIATNSRTRSELNGHLTVEFPPTFESTPMKENWSWDGRPVNISCLAEAIPNATISWFFRSQIERAIDENDPNIRIIGRESNSTLEIRPVDRAQFGFYKCVATNKLGRAEHSIWMREAHRPGRILQVIVHEKTATSITFKIVGPTEESGLRITQFIIQHRHSYNTWDTAKSNAFPVDLGLYTIESLEPMTSYTFRFAAENQVGVGDWASEMSEIMPKRSVPEPPAILNGINSQGFIDFPYPDFFELRWTTPADNGERIDYFQITYIPVVSSTDPYGNQAWETLGTIAIEEKPLGEPRHTIRSLNPSTYYRLEIRAHNAIGFSNPSKLIFKTAHSTGGRQLERKSDAMISVPAIIILVIIALFVILFIVDFACYRFNEAGIIWSISRKCCGSKKRSPSLVGSSTKGSKSEKEPLNDPFNPEVGHQDNKIHSEPDDSSELKPQQIHTNGNNGRSYEPKDSTPV